MESDITGREDLGVPEEMKGNGILRVSIILNKDMKVEKDACS